MVLGLKESASVKRLRWLLRVATRHNARVISRYFAENAVRKLHLGYGFHRHAGWLNCDVEPMRDAIILDATKSFPFAENTFLSTASTWWSTFRTPAVAP